MTRLAYISDIKSIIPLLMEYRTFYGIKELFNGISKTPMALK